LRRSVVATTAVAGQATADWNAAVAEKNERLNDYILALHVYNAHQQRHRDVDQPKMAAVRRGGRTVRAPLRVLQSSPVAWRAAFLRGRPNSTCKCCARTSRSGPRTS